MHQNQKAVFDDLLLKAIKVSEESFISACLQYMDKAELDQFLSRNNLVDLTLKFLNGEIRTNKILLAAQIPYFANLFKSGMKEASAGQLDLKDTDAILFSELLHFAYFNKINIHQDNYRPLYELAAFYGLDALQKNCADWMAKNISEDNFQDMLALAHDQKLDALKKACEDWISAHVQDFDNARDLQDLIGFYKLKPINQPAIQNAVEECFAQKKDLSKEKDLVQHLSQLEVLDLSPFITVREDQLRQLISLCPNVRKLISHNHDSIRKHENRDIHKERLILIAKSMPKLESLSLAGYHITDFSPIAPLTQLKQLTIEDVHIDNPHDLLELKNLKKLNILQGCIPRDVFPYLPQLTNLRKLHIVSTGQNLVSVCELKNLRSLILENAYVEGLDLSQLKNLKTLILPVFFSPSAFDRLPDLTPVQTLLLNVSNLADLTFLTKLPLLEELRLYGVRESHLPLPPLPNLKKLDLISPYGVVVRDPTFLQSFSALEKLSLKGFHAHPQKPQLPLPNLKALAFEKSEGFKLDNLTELKRLRIKECSPELAPLPKLKILEGHLHANTDITRLFTPSLEIIDLTTSRFAFNNFVPCLPQATGLRKLKLMNAMIDDYSFLTHLQKLEELSLPNCNISDLSVLSLLKNLKVLNLSFCHNIKSFDPLANLPHLHTLHLVNSRYKKITASLAPLADLKNLKTINYLTY